MENNNVALKYYQMVVTPGTKVWWLLHHVASFNVAQLNINSDHFAQRHQKKDVQKQEEQYVSRCQGGSEIS